MKNLIEKIKEFFNSLPASKYLLFILGMFLCAFVAIVIPKFAEWLFFALSFLAVFVTMIIYITKGKANWWDCLAFCLGTLPIQILLWIA